MQTPPKFMIACVSCQKIQLYAFNHHNYMRSKYMKLRIWEFSESLNVVALVHLDTSPVMYAYQPWYVNLTAMVSWQPYNYKSIGQRRYVLYASACTDGSGFYSRGNQSWGPYTGVCFYLPSLLRNKFACLFMFGVMPIIIRNYNRTTLRALTTYMRDSMRVKALKMILNIMFIAGLVRAILADCKDFLW